MNLMFKQILIFILMIFPIIAIAVIPSDTLSIISKAIISFIYIVVGGIIFYYFYHQQALNLQKILLIGLSGVGKTQTYNYLKCKTIMNFNNFQLGQLGNLCIVDTPTLDLESSTDKRDDTRQQFQQFFVNFKTSISALLVVVNFERTDLMKQKIMQTIKHIKKFEDMIYILITDFHLSEDHDNDKSHLQKSLQYLHLKGIIFLNREENEKMIIEELNAIELKSSHQEFDINGTLFAINDEQMNVSIMNQNKQKLHQINSPLHENLINNQMKI